MVYAQSEFVWDNVTHEFPWDFELLTDHLISTRQPDLLIADKKKGREPTNRGFCRSGLSPSQTKRKRKKHVPRPW